MTIILRIPDSLKNIYWPMVILIAIQRLVDAEIYIVIGAALLVLFMGFSGKVHLNLGWGFWILCAIAVWGALIGLLTVGQGYSRDWIRDVFYYVNPIVFIALAAYFAKSGVNFTKFCNSLILGNLFHVFTFFFTYITEGTFEAANQYIYIPLALLLVNKFDERYSFKKITRIILIILFLVPVALGNSRAVMAETVIIFIVCSIDKNNIRAFTTRLVQILIIVAIGVIMFYQLSSDERIELMENKVENSINEANPFQDWSDYNNIQKNWRGYEIYCAFDECMSGNLFQTLFGYGFSKRIYVGEYAYTLLGQEESTGEIADDIAVLHNGYGTILVKVGVIGLIMLLIYYIGLTRKGFQFTKITGDVEGKFLAACMISLIFQTYLLRGLYTKQLPLCYCLVIGYVGYRMKYYSSLPHEEHPELY